MRIAIPLLITWHIVLSLLHTTLWFEFALHYISFFDTWISTPKKQKIWVFLKFLFFSEELCTYLHKKILSKLIGIQIWGPRLSRWILHLPREMTVMIDRAHIWNVIYTMRLATGIILQPHQRLRLPCKIAWHSNITKCCACPAKWRSNITKCGACQKKNRPHHQMLRLPRKWLSWLILLIYKTSFTMRGHLAPRSPSLLFALRRRTLYWKWQRFVLRLAKFHQILRLPRRVTLQHHHMLRLLRKVTLQHHQMRRLSRKDPATSPNAAPATKMTLMIDPPHI